MTQDQFEMLLKINPDLTIKEAVVLLNKTKEEIEFEKKVVAIRERAAGFRYNEVAKKIWK